MSPVSVGSLANVSRKPTVTGGTLFSDATYYYRLFTAFDILYVKGAGGIYSEFTMDVLTVAAGGGGGASNYYATAGGGGAGSVKMQTVRPDKTWEYGFYIYVSGGGSGGYFDSAANTWSSGNYAGYTYFQSYTSKVPSIFPLFGGFGGTTYGNCYDGASGGGVGGGYWWTPVTAYAGTPGEGNAGGNFVNNSPGTYYPNFWSSGGGGGFGAAASGVNGGNGVNTYASWLTACGINNDSGYVAGGGGGTWVDTYQGFNINGGGTGGLGGSSNGFTQPGSLVHAKARTGGGGGGYCAASSLSGYGANGGSGFVIVRYLKTAVA